MDRKLLSPRWIVAHIVVIVIAIIFVRLGFWQLDRLEERRLENLVGESRIEAPPVPVDDLLLQTGEDHESLRYMRALATGTYDPDHEVLIRSQVHLGTAGFHVITPLVRDDGTAVLVNRGWIPLTLDRVPVEQASPVEGDVLVEGWISPSQQRPPLGPVDPQEGRLVAMSRVDIERIQAQIPYRLAPVYLVALDGSRDELPVPVDPPDFSDEGPHLAYAIQWFAFTIIGVVGYYFLVRRRVAPAQAPSREMARSSTTS